MELGATSTKAEEVQGATASQQSQPGIEEKGQEEKKDDGNPNGNETSKGEEKPTSSSLGPSVTSGNPSVNHGKTSGKRPSSSSTDESAPAGAVDESKDEDSDEVEIVREEAAPKRPKSEYFGVRLVPKKGLFRASFIVNSVPKDFGSYENEELAALVVDLNREKLFKSGELKQVRRRNFSDEERVELIEKYKTILQLNFVIPRPKGWRKRKKMKLEAEKKKATESSSSSSSSLPHQGGENDSSEEAVPLNEVCYVCGSSQFDADRIVLLCDGKTEEGQPCPNALHLDCGGLSQVPEGDWYCSKCRDLLDV